MQFLAWATLYLIVGAICAAKGPAAQQIALEVLRSGPANKSKLRLFKTILVLAVILLWPLLVVSAIRIEKRRSATIFALASKDRAVEAGTVLAAMNRNPVDADLLPDASGEFGYSPDNPVPTTNILATENYLSRLRHPNGRPIEFKRIGSFASETTEFPVDGYRVTPGQDAEEPIVLYFSPYQLRCSRLAPRGFKFAKTEHITLVPDEAPAVAETPAPEQPTNATPSPAEPERVAAMDMLDRIRKRANEGDVDAQVEMGLHHLTQPPTAQNAMMGERWLTKAATQGHARAQYELGNILVEGQLLPWNLEQARKWMGAAAEQNYPNALERLAAMPVYADSQLRQMKSSIFTGPKDNIHAPSPHRKERLKRSKGKDRDIATPPSPLNMALYYWNESDSENQKFYAKGQMAALECFARARKRVEAVASGYSIWTDFDMIRDEARAIAEKRGILEIGEDNGMVGEIDGSDLFFDERRAAFISGVEDALEGATQFRDE